MALPIIIAREPEHALLRAAVAGGNDERIRKEAADLANFAMMIFDNHKDGPTP